MTGAQTVARRWTAAAPAVLGARWLVLAVPTTSALLFAVALRQPTAAAAGLAVLFGSVFVGLAVLDLERQVLPNAIVLPALALALSLSWVWPDRSVAEALLGGAAALAPMLAVFSLSRGGLGGGDVKMATLVGVVVGYPAVLTALLVASVSAGVVAVSLLVVGAAGRRATIPHGPFLAIAGLVALV